MSLKRDRSVTAPNPAFLKCFRDAMRPRPRVRGRAGDNDAEIFPVVIARVIAFRTHLPRNTHPDIPKVRVCAWAGVRQHMIFIRKADPFTRRVPYMHVR